MIELLIVAAGAASAGGFGSLAWWTSSRHADGRADAVADRAAGFERLARRLPASTGQVSVSGPLRTRRDGQTVTSPRVIVGEIVAVTGATDASDSDTCPRCGQRPVVAGARAQGPDGTVVAVCGGCLEASASADAAIWSALADGQSGACPGRLVRHQDGSLSCHSGRDDCWPGQGTAYTHGPEIRCGSLSHGCGQCLTSRGAR